MPMITPLMTPIAEAPRAPLGCLRTSVFAMRVVGDEELQEWSPQISSEIMDDHGIADTLGGWAEVQRSRRPMKPNNPNANKSVTVVNEHKLAQRFAMPENGRTDEAPLCDAKMAPSDKSLKKGQKWCMMDSGAGCHAANRKKDVANFQTKKTKNPMRCVLADGKDIQSKSII